MRTSYDVLGDRWTLDLRSQQQWGCEEATHLLMQALGGPEEDFRVRVAGAVLELSVEEGRLVQLTVWSASTVLQDDVLFEAEQRADDDELGPF